MLFGGNSKILFNGHIDKRAFYKMLFFYSGISKEGKGWEIFYSIQGFSKKIWA